jgi:chromosome segregation ATPase
MSDITASQFRAQAEDAKEQIATLTAERDALEAELHQTNELYYAACDEITNLTAERDAARATVAKLLAKS